MKPVSVVFKTVVALSMLMLFWSCSHNTAQFHRNIEIGQVETQLPEHPQVEEPRIVLNAHPRVGFAPLRVSFHAQVQNVASTNQNFTCLWEEWNFGDGSVSAEQRSCGSSGSDLRIDTQFAGEHLYTEGGVYTVRFILGENSIISNKITIRVVPRSGSY